MTARTGDGRFSSFCLATGLCAGVRFCVAVLSLSSNAEEAHGLLAFASLSLCTFAIAPVIAGRGLDGVCDLDDEAADVAG